MIHSFTSLVPCRFAVKWTDNKCCPEGEDCFLHINVPNSPGGLATLQMHPSEVLETWEVASVA